MVEPLMDVRDLGVHPRINLDKIARRCIKNSIILAVCTAKEFHLLTRDQ